MRMCEGRPGAKWSNLEGGGIEASVCRARRDIGGCRDSGDGRRRSSPPDCHGAGRLEGPGPDRGRGESHRLQGARPAGGRLLLARVRGDPRRRHRGHAARRHPIGIGAGAATDGQALVFHHLLGNRDGATN